MLYPLLFAAGAVTLLFYVKEKLKAYSIKALILKSTVSVLFLFTAMAGLCRSFTVSGVLILAGLLLGLMGDVWLDLKYVYRADDRVYTYAGFLSFLVGHLFFITAMLMQYFAAGLYPYVLVPVAAAVVVGILIGVLGPKIGMEYGEFKTVSMVYGAVLFAMTFIAGALALAYGFKTAALNRLFVGGALFAISDLVLCGTYFGGKERKGDIIVNYLTYYGAQFLIASAIACIA